MVEVHQTNIMKKCCRICGATAPKHKIVHLKIEQAHWFGIETTQYKICDNCSIKYQLYKDKRFDSVQSKFGLAQGLMSTICTPQNPCWFCYQALEWKETKKIAIVPGKSNSQDPTKPKLNMNTLKKFFQKRMDQQCTTVSMEPLFIKEKRSKESKRVNHIYRIAFHGKVRDFLWDEACKSVYSFSKSSSTGIKKHIQSTEHQRMVSRLTENQNEDIVLDDVPESAFMHNPSQEQWDNFKMIMVQGLFGTGKLAPAALSKPLLRETFSKALYAINVANDVNKILPSTSSAVRMIQTAAYDRTMKTKQEIQDAITDNPDIKFTLLHDDGTLRNGNNENLRTFSLVWITKDGMINKRYLKSMAATEKDTNAITTSIKKIVDEFNINEKYVFLTDAASVNIAAANQLDADIAVCGPHTLHNTFRNGLKQLAAEEQAFKNFFGDIKTILSKASRKHLNHLMLSEPGWRKMKSYVETRWCSLVDCLDSLIHNWEFLQGQTLSIVDNHSKPLLEEFYQMVLPFKASIKAMETTKQTSGHLVAMELNHLLIFYINYANDSSKPALLQALASKFVFQLECYMDGVHNPHRLKRICSIRLIQTAMYLPSGYLNCFNVQVDNEEKQISIQNRHKRLQNELEALLDDSNADPNEIRRNSRGDTELAVEIRQFSMLASKYHDPNNTSTVIGQFKADEQNQLDANLNFWNSDFSKEFLPNLRAKVLPLLSISASTSLVEGTFSFSNHIRTSTRSKLNTVTLNNYLTLLYATFDN